VIKRKEHVFMLPIDWDHHAAWEAHYAGMQATTPEFFATAANPGSFNFHRIMGLIDELRSAGQRSVWFPGCGLSPLPRLFAWCGFEVIATDVSNTALEYQRGNTAVIATLRAQLSLPEEPTTGGHLLPLQADFREPFGDDRFDVILNVKSIQGLGPDSMRAALSTHARSLRPGRTAFFDTMNVQGARRDQLENALVAAGFFRPFHEAEKEYRQALAATGFAYVEILGRPMPVDETGHRQTDKDLAARARASFQPIQERLAQRLEAERERESQRANDARTKLAVVIYSTG
jgi:SAM-dependent methyltransferase